MTEETKNRFKKFWTITGIVLLSGLCLSFLHFSVPILITAGTCWVLLVPVTNHFHAVFYTERELSNINYRDAFSIVETITVGISMYLIFVWLSLFISTVFVSIKGLTKDPGPFQLASEWLIGINEAVSGWYIGLF